MTQRPSALLNPPHSLGSNGDPIQARDGHDEGFVLIDWVRNNAMANPNGLPGKILASLSEAPVPLRVCAGLVPGLYVLFNF